MKTGMSVQDNITKSLDGMINRSSSISSYLNRNLWRQYQKAQMERFKSENASETGQWDALSPKYVSRKKKLASNHAWPGGGDKIMIASGKLADAAMGRSSNYTKLVSNTSFSVSINTGAIPYAIYPGTQRPYMAFSESTEERFKRGITEFITKNIEVSL